MAAWPLAPPVHVHEMVDEAGHHAAVAHSHAEEHHRRVAVAQKSLLEIEDEDRVVTTLDPVFVSASLYIAKAPAAVVVALIDQPPVLAHVVRAFYVVARLNQGPPRAPNPLRGPPAAHS